MSAWTTAVGLLTTPAVWWRLGEASGTNLADASGSSHAGTLSGTTIGYGVAGPLAGDSDTAMSFTGTNPVGQVAYGAWADNSVFSVSCWFKAGTLAATNALHGRDSQGGGRRYQLVLDSTGHITFTTIGSASTGTAGPTGTAYNDGLWHFVTIVYDQALTALSRQKIYVDGSSTPVTNGGQSNNLNATGTAVPFSVGNLTRTTQVPANSSIDEILFWPGTALTGADHLALYQAGVNAVVAGGQATQTSTAEAGSVSVGAVFISGGLVTVTASIAAGVVLAGALVSGGAATETSTAQAGTVATGTLIPGGQTGTTDTAQAGTVTAGALVAGGQAGETDTVLAGATVVYVVGGQVTQTSTAVAGNPVHIVDGGQVTQTSTAIDGSSGTTTIAGGLVTQTNTIVAGTADDGYIDTDTTNNVYAIMFDGDGDVEWEPAVTVRPAFMPHSESVTAAVALDDVVVDTLGQVAVTKVVKSVPRTRDRILIDNQDWTFRDDVWLETPDFELLQPLGYGAGGTLRLTQFDARYAATSAPGRLRRVGLKSKVVYQVVNDDPTSVDFNEVVRTDYKGFVSKQRRYGSSLELEVQGEALGRLSTKWHPIPIFRKVRDAGVLLFNAFVGAGLRFHPRLPTLDINLASSGGVYDDQFVASTLAVLTTREGDQWTVMPLETGTHKGAYHAVLKDRETINATVYLDNELAIADLSDDLTEKYNRVWVNAVAPDGQRINFATAPNMQSGNVPERPLVSGSSMALGDADEDTDTGEGVTVLVWRLTFVGWLDKDDLPGGFDEDVEDAVKKLQKEAGLTQNGQVTDATWDALWDNTTAGYSYQFAAQRPAAQTDAVQKFDRSGNGSIIGRHDGYDEHEWPVDLALQMGMTLNRGRAQRYAEGELHPTGLSDWTGTITLTSGLIAGEHNPGDALVEADVISNRAVRPGWNIWEPYFDGGTLFHVVACQVSDQGRTVTLVVDTRAGDALKVWETIQRDRENRQDPSRTLGGVRRSSTTAQDTVVVFDKISGQTDRTWPLVNGWNEIPVPSGQTGTVQRTHILLDEPHEFAALVTAKRVPIERLNDKISPLQTPTVDPQRHHLSIEGTVTGGTFTLDGNSDTTSSITYGATAGAVQAAVRGLGGAFAGAHVIKITSKTYTITMPSALDLDVGTNSLTGDSPSMSVTTTGPGSGEGTPWYRDEDVLDWLEPYEAKIGWGTLRNPCGYDPNMKTSPETGAATAAVLTGKHVDNSSFGYDTHDEAALYLYIWVENANALPRQRIFNQQLDGSGA